MLVCVCVLLMLVPCLGKDFIKDEVDPEKARDAFSKLYNMEHIQEVLDDLEAIIIEATEEGRDPADILADQHMVFVGPPGTGKTTVRFSMAGGPLGHDCCSGTMMRHVHLVSRRQAQSACASVVVLSAPGPPVAAGTCRHRGLALALLAQRVIVCAADAEARAGATGGQQVRSAS